MGKSDLFADKGCNPLIPLKPSFVEALDDLKKDLEDSEALEEINQFLINHGEG